MSCLCFGQVLSVTLVRYQDAASRRLVVEFIHVALAKSPEAVARTIHAGLLEVSPPSANFFNPKIYGGRVRKDLTFCKANMSKSRKDKFEKDLYSSENVLRRAQASFLLDVRPLWLDIGLFPGLTRKDRSFRTYPPFIFIENEWGGRAAPFAQYHTFGP
jgi:hypothetical protein